MDNQNESKHDSEVSLEDENNTQNTSAESIEEETERLKVLVQENTELKDQILRLAAEIENLRRRTARDIQETRSYAITGFARDMLIVSDDLRRGLDLISQEKKEIKDSTLSGFIEGMELTERTLLSTLERHGIKKIIPYGEKFDPNFHQAMFEAPHADFPANTVMQVIQAGYVIGDRVLRPAMVGVSASASKTTNVESSDASECACKNHNNA